MKRPSLKLRITGWFALMMFVIEALVLAFLLAVNGTVATNDPEARLVRMVEHNANRVKYNNRQFRFSRIHYNRSGVYTVLYDADGNVLQGTFPAEFTPAEPLPLGSETVRLVDCGDNEYYVYDVHVDMMVGSVWLRGVINADANGGVMRVILPLAWSLLPVLLVLSVIGGYFIASRALRPVRQLTATANAISDGQDLKARIGLPHTSGSDEIYQLSASFDNMFDRLERSFEAEQRFTSDASHELRTPTTVILAACEDARKTRRRPRIIRRRSMSSTGRRTRCRRSSAACSRSRGSIRARRRSTGSMPTSPISSPSSATSRPWSRAAASASAARPSRASSSTWTSFSSRASCRTCSITPSSSAWTAAGSMSRSGARLPGPS